MVYFTGFVLAVDKKRWFYDFHGRIVPQLVFSAYKLQVIMLYEVNEQIHKIFVPLYMSPNHRKRHVIGLCRVRLCVCASDCDSQRGSDINQNKSNQIKYDFNDGWQTAT